MPRLGKTRKSIAREEAIVAAHARHMQATGLPPTLEDLREAAGLKSRGATCVYRQKLVAEGRIERLTLRQALARMNEKIGEIEYFRNEATRLRNEVALLKEMRQNGW